MFSLCQLITLPSTFSRAAGFAKRRLTNKHVQLTNKLAGQITLFHGLYVDAVLQADDGAHIAATFHRINCFGVCSEKWMPFMKDVLKFMLRE
jgi:hypothetical protein